MALFGDTPVKGNRKTVEKDKGNEIKMSVVNTDTFFAAYNKYLHLKPKITTLLGSILNKLYASIIY